jgi:branched-chain amino acid transport system ATP-binding protein
MIDELSLGLSPEVTKGLQQRLRELRDTGTAIVVVEQSIDRAVELADRAYFLDRGTVRYAGPTAGLLDHPDLVRATFLGAAAASASPPPHPESSSGTAGAPRLELTGIRRRFGGVVALDDVSLTLHAGEIVGIVGPNGAGKTTLFDVVSGFVPPDAGSIVLHRDGAVVELTALSAHGRARLGLGRSFQDGRLFPALTVRETIAVACERSVQVRNPVAAAAHLPAVARSERAVHARVDELVALLGLGDSTDRFGHELSTGTRRIVDLACVLAHSPSVLLLDEPASGISQREAEALGPILRDVRDTLGAGMLVIEHDLGVLATVADRLVALDLGRVVASGPPGTVLADPAVSRSYLGG